MTVLLELREVHAYYGNIRAIRGISLSLLNGEILGLIGANGAGKTTILKTISGLVRPKKGEIFFEGQPLHTLSPFEIVARGISHVPEGRRIFCRLTVIENLRMGAYLRRDEEGIRRDMEEVFSLFPRLKERRKQVAGTLSGGEQQMLAIARSLMARPKLLLMDEPSMGLSPILVEAIFDTIKKINEQGTSVFLVEQNAALTFSMVKRCYVIQTGTIALEGTPQELSGQEMVRKLYLGLD